jgi:hypothetical protein
MKIKLLFEIVLAAFCCNLFKALLDEVELVILVDDDVDAVAVALALEFDDETNGGGGVLLLFNDKFIFLLVGDSFS